MYLHAYLSVSAIDPENLHGLFNVNAGVNDVTRFHRLDQSLQCHKRSIKVLSSRGRPVWGLNVWLFDSSRFFQQPGI